MFSEDTQNLLARILLALAEGEKNVEDARRELSSEGSYNIQAIFKTLDYNGDNFITPKDIQKYLLEHGLEVNLIEIKLFLLFYDQDHDYTLTYGEIFKFIHPGKKLPKIPKYMSGEELDVKVDRKLYNLIEKEILMARIILALLDEIKHKRDFNIHNAFHILKYYACITGDSINLFLKKCGYQPTAGDIRAIVKRLDINNDDIIDFCEFHAFIGFPDCYYTCPCFPCPNCGVKYCKNCLQDIPCYLLGCDHKGMDSKMRCTSPEHIPGGHPLSSFINLYMNNPRTKNFSPKYDDDLNYNDNVNKNNIPKKNQQNYKPSGINDSNLNNLNNNGKNGNIPFNMSSEQYNILKGLTDPEQFKKFNKLSEIMNRQKEKGINLTDNLALENSPRRDFDPREWGCISCECNIHGNPNVPCNCCQCNLCPYEVMKQNIGGVKKNTNIFSLKVPLYSYTYNYEPNN